MDREQIVYRAKLAEEAERYEDMVKSVKELAQKSSGANLSVEERNLLSGASLVPPPRLVFVVRDL